MRRRISPGQRGVRRGASILLVIERKKAYEGNSQFSFTLAYQRHIRGAGKILAGFIFRLYRRYIILRLRLPRAAMPLRSAICYAQIITLRLVK